jgi:ribosomal 30S subunit maturation factor RimM
MWLPSSDVYVVKNGNDEYLIPIIPEVVKRVDHDQGIIMIVPMDGLLG